MSILLDILLGGTAALLMIPVLVVLAEVLLAISSASADRSETSAADRPRLAVLIPAHNEALGIAWTLRAIIPQLRNDDCLVVVADNCSDDTATVARELGVDVIVRDDQELRGKGYALEYGVRYLASDAPEVVVIVDADCIVESGTLDRLARRCAQSVRPVQALYLMRNKGGATASMRIAELAWLIKNYVRPLGLRRLGLPCQLMGTGMALPWSQLRSVSLATGHIVEDLKLGIELGRQGNAPLFCPEAVVTSNFPNSGEGARGQRERWEHGHLNIIVGEVPRLLIRSVMRLDASLLALTLDVSVPPLALLALQLAVVWLASLMLFAATRAEFPIVTATAGALLLLGAVLLAWDRFGRHVVTLGGLALALAYALRKIPLYARYLVARQQEWVRSKRDQEGPKT